MIIENFKNGDAKPVYRRFSEKGRLASDDLKYISSWVDETMSKCFQVMETDDRKLIEQWMENWKDLVDFEIYPVMTSAAAFEKVKPYL